MPERSAKHLAERVLQLFRGCRAKMNALPASASPTRQQGLPRRALAEGACRPFGVLLAGRLAHTVTLFPSSTSLTTTLRTRAVDHPYFSTAAQSADGGVSLLPQSQQAVVDGTIKKVQYRSSDSGYTVLKVGVSPESLANDAGHGGDDGRIPEGALEGASSMVSKYRKRKNKQNDLSITVVGILPVLHVGQGVTVQGTWTTHPTYGMQLRASHVETRTPSGQEDLISFLSSGAIHGVGPSTAGRMVDVWGSDILDVLDSADAVVKLRQCEGIGANKAIAIKTAWDSGRDAREGATYLCERGIPAGPAQRVAEAFGAETQGRVLADPYATLSRFGIPLDSIEAFAVKTNANASDLISRMSLVITKCLMASSNRDGHAYLTWGELERLVFRRLDVLARKYGGLEMKMTEEHLKLVAWHMAQKKTLVCEAGRLAAAGEHGAGHAFDGAVSVPAVPREELQRVLSCISKKQFDSLVGTHGDSLASVLCQEPDRSAELLQSCPGIGPKTAEKIIAAWKNGRPDAGGKSALGSMVRVGDLIDAAGGNQSNLEAPCEWSESVRCYLPQFHKAETAIVRCVEEKARLIKDANKARMQKIKQWVDMNQETTDVVLSAGQRAAIEMASDAPILVITGGPGCGKTTVLQSIVKLWCAQGKMVNICAPTGRAAQRIGAIQNVEPSTIHRLLKYRPKTSTDQNENLQSVDEEEIDMGEMDWFEHGLSNKLESDAVLVDEASMLSLPLAAALMQALKTKTQLILVGDVDQLPPVGPGGILDAMISSGVVPVIDLREIFRQEMTSTIVTSALAVRGGAYPPIEVVPVDDDGVDRAISRVGASIMRTSEDIVEPVERLVRGFLYDKNADLGDIQVISPMRKGPVGVSHLNPRIQAIVNPPELGKLEVSRGDLVLRMGDRVLQLHNDYDKDVYNGDQGTIVDVDPVSKKVWVVFSKGFGSGGQLIEYSGMELSHLDLAYAVTIHKAQGGEAKKVIMVLSNQHGPKLLTRPLLYTGITRARETLVVVVDGSGPGADPMTTAVQNIGVENRLSSLVERLVSRATSSSLPFHDVISYYDEEDDVEVVDRTNGGNGSSNPVTTNDARVNGTEAEQLEDHIRLVSLACTNGRADQDQIMTTVPLLLSVNKSYLERSIAFSEKIDSEDEASLEGNSLVLQLARLRSRFRTHSYREP